MHGLLHPCDVEFDRLYDKLDRTLKNLSVDDADETGKVKSRGSGCSGNYRLWKNCNL